MLCEEALNCTSLTVELRSAPLFLEQIFEQGTRVLDDQGAILSRGGLLRDPLMRFRGQADGCQGRRRQKNGRYFPVRAIPRTA